MQRYVHFVSGILQMLLMMMMMMVVVVMTAISVVRWHVCVSKSPIIHHSHIIAAATAAL